MSNGDPTFRQGERLQMMGCIEFQKDKIKQLKEENKELKYILKADYNRTWEEDSDQRIAPQAKTLEEDAPESGS